MARYFEEELIEQIRNANDIVSVISEHVTLKKKGKTYWGCCPFHNEKTPSFSVNEERGLFHCFGCKAGGNVFSFVQKYENLTFPEAVEKLAKRANITIPEEERDPKAIAREKHKERMYEINDLAAVFFHNCLTKTNMGKGALSYLLKRGLTMENIHHFRLGYAPDNWSKLYDAFKKRGYTDQELVEAGLIRKGKKSYYDYFRNRVMFPIADGRGRVVGFGGRVMDDSTPKYLNSSETKMFDKGHLLFAFDKAHRRIRELGQVILMEGYMDVITAHCNQITNVVASLGTALTTHQIHLLQRQAKDVVLAYDMDNAGRMAVKRAIDLLRPFDFTVRVMVLPDGKDPDEFIRKNGEEAFLTIVKKAQSAFAFLFTDALARHDVTEASGKITFLEEMFSIVAKETTSMKRHALLEELESLLRSQGIDIRGNIAIYFEEFLENKKIEFVDEPEPDVKTIRNRETAEDTVMAYALQDEKALRAVLHFLEYQDFTSTLYQSMLEKLNTALSKGQSLSIPLMEEIFSEEERQEMEALLVLDREDRHRGFYIDIMRIRIQSLNHQYEIHSKRADQYAHEANSTEKMFAELQICEQIKKQKQQCLQEMREGEYSE